MSSDAPTTATAPIIVQHTARYEDLGVATSAGSKLSISDGWCVAQVRVRRQIGLPSSLDAIAERARVPAEVLRPAFHGAVNAGYLTDPGDGGDLDLTPVGAAESDRIVAAVRSWIIERLAPDGAPGQPGTATVTGITESALDRALDNLARTMLTDEVPTNTGRHLASVER